MEINILKGPICFDFNERLDQDILQLRNKCQTLINDIENKRRGKFTQTNVERQIFHYLMIYVVFYGFSLPF